MILLITQSASMEPKDSVIMRLTCNTEIHIVVLSPTDSSNYMYSSNYSVSERRYILIKEAIPSEI